MSDTELTVVLTAMSILATGALSYLFYRLNSKERRPVYMMTGNRVVSGGEAIEVLFGGERVSRVTRTIVFFWNAGRDSIRAEDFREQLTFRVSEGRLLRATLVRATRAEIRPHLKANGEEAELTFSHLDAGDGCCVELLHTGKDVVGASVSAVIVGVRSGPRFVASPFWDDPAGAWIGYVMAAGGVAGALWATITRSWEVAVAMLATAVFCWRGADRSRRQDKRYLPREFWDLSLPPNPRVKGGFTSWRRSK